VRELLQVPSPNIQKFYQESPLVLLLPPHKNTFPERPSFIFYMPLIPPPDQSPVHCLLSLFTQTPLSLALRCPSSKFFFPKSSIFQSLGGSVPSKSLSPCHSLKTPKCFFLFPCFPPTVDYVCPSLNSCSPSAPNPLVPQNTPPFL